MQSPNNSALSQIDYINDIKPLVIQLYQSWNHIKQFLNNYNKYFIQIKKQVLVRNQITRYNKAVLLILEWLMKRVYTHLQQMEQLMTIIKEFKFMFIIKEYQDNHKLIVSIVIEVITADYEHFHERFAIFIAILISMSNNVLI